MISFTLPRHFFTLLFSSLLLHASHILVASLPADGYEDAVLSSDVPYTPPPKIITDLSKIYSCHGIPVDYSYNETTSKTDEHTGSVPGCPQSIDGIPWIHYGHPPRCYLARQNGPCPLGEKLFPQMGSTYGVCTCECLLEEETFQKLEQSAGRYFSCEMDSSEGAPYGQIYDKESKTCHKKFIHGEGACEQDKVIVGMKEDKIVCSYLCDLESSDFEKQPGNGCRVPSRSYAAVGEVKQNECEPEQHYSETLKACTSKAKFVL